ncbi:MAG: choice-of-anchor D domain-containing protein, partial [Myxococcaceae bacterium]
SWDPNILDFKYVTPGVQVTREVTFSNAGPSDVQLSQIKPLNMAEFWVVAAAGADATRLTVPKAEKNSAGAWVPGTAKLTVAFKPLQLGPRQTQLQFQTNLAKQPTGFVTLKGFGGGPDIQVTPSPTLNFGQVAFFQGANSFQKRKLTVMNIGTAPAVPDAAANLRLGKAAANGDWSAPFVEVFPLNADTDPTEFEVIVPTLPTYDPAVGLQAVAGKNKVDLEVKITPKSIALKQAEIHIYSNDPDQPVYKITVSADAVNLPPCNYEVTPSVLSFGLISAPDYRDLSFQIRNNGTGAGDICLLSSLDIAAGSDAAFSLPDGPIDSYTMQPGETKQIKVRVHPTGQTPSGVTNIQGIVEFFMSSPSRPSFQVVLNAQLAPSCLTIAPDDLDFGTVKVGCSSQTRSFLIYNTCSAPVTVTNFSLQNAGGFPAGDARCSNPGQPCPEYIEMRTLPITGSGLVLNSGDAPQEFQIKYRPIDIGADNGAVAINATQNGTQVTYVVSLTGRGDTVGIQTDVFMQDAKPKADILLVIDNSGSMGDELASLAANFGSFIKYANSAKVDYHIAVTTSDNTKEGGTFVFGAGHPEKVLSPTTFDVETKFKAKVNVGTNGSATEMCFEPALRGLTAPKVNAENAGFLRNEAALALVCITDEEEQSPQSVTYYQ